MISLVIFVILAFSNTLFAQVVEPCCWELNCPNGFQIQPTLKITIGAFINQIVDVNIITPQVGFDYYVWLKWDNCIRDYQNNSVQAHVNLQLINTLGNNVQNVPTYTYPICDVFPGQAYWEVRVQGIFYQKFDFSQYPLDSHSINFQFEDAVLGYSYLQYQKDILTSRINGVTYGASGLKENLTVASWNLGSGILERESTSFYNTTDFEVAYQNNAYSNYRFGVIIRRGTQVYGAKVIPPVFFATMTGFLLLLFDIEMVGSRLQSMGGVVIGIIFLQLFFDSSIPVTDTLTLVDWLFNITYLLTIGTFIETVVVRDYYFSKLNVIDDIIDEMSLLKTKRDEEPPLSEFLKPMKKKKKITKMEQFTKSAKNLVGQGEEEKEEEEENEQAMELQDNNASPELSEKMKKKNFHLLTSKNWI